MKMGYRQGDIFKADQDKVKQKSWDKILQNIITASQMSVYTTKLP